jgi:Flp pilus assembly protein TadG
MNVHNRKIERKNDRSGAAVVELAIALPILFFIVLATVEVCNGIFLKQSLSVMAYEGARVAVTPDAIKSDIEQQVAAFADARRVTINRVTVTPDNYAEQPIGSYIEVQVQGESSSAGGIFSDGRSTATVSMMKNY